MAGPTAVRYGYKGYILIFLIIIGLLTVLISWLVLSDQTYPNRVKSGSTYKIKGQEYPIPNLPHKMYLSKQEPHIERPIPALAQSTLDNLHTLIQKTFETLTFAKVEFWCTGGTLLSAELWKSLMVYDDDADISVKWTDREYLWSSEFATLCDLRNLEVMMVRGASLTFATKDMATVRLRTKGTTFPHLDIFFTKQIDEDHWAKVDSWSGTEFVTNPKETWNADWLFPLQTRIINNIPFPIANQPEKLLDKQYGPNWRKYIQSPNPYTRSHMWAILITSLFGTWTKPTLLQGRTEESLVNVNG